MEVAKRITRLVGCLMLSVMMVFTLIPGLSLMDTAYAAAGDIPDHNKQLTDNEDGTYTIALDITGEAEKKMPKVNVIVIVDRSGSMNSQSGTGAYEPSNQNGPNMYGLIDGNYVSLTRRDEGWGSNPRYTYWYNGTQYTGQRYQYDSTGTRMQATKAALDGLASTLLGYNGKDGNPDDTVEMALVTFGTTAQTSVTSTTSSDTYIGAVNNISVATGNAAGTNWEAALNEAKDIGFGDSDPTFVIFFSDGSPTFRTTQAGYNDRFQEGVYGTGQEEEPNMERAYTQAVDDATQLAAKVGADKFYTIFAYGTNVGANYMRNLTTAAGAPAGNNYSASSTAELNDAFAEILESIEMSGFADVEIDDGTTNQVTTSSGVVELLEVDESSYKYYRSGGTYGEKTEWKSTDDPAPPEAKLVDGAVEWDLSSLGVLEDGVTYTVTFDCYPSQTTYDIIAKLKNGDLVYSELDPEIQKYIVDNGGGNYSLRTNTNATLSWDDTCDTEGQQTENYINPDPVATAADSLPIKKEWQGANPDVEELTLSVLMDGNKEDVFHEAKLNADNNWKTSSFISVGIIKNGQVLPGAEGHDFSFAELDDSQYHWEIDAPTVRPMRIGNDIVMLIKVDEDHHTPSGATKYTIDGAEYYADTASAGLTATNHRRSNLNLTKTVTGEDAPKNATFPFTLTVNNALAPKTEPLDDPEHGSDYWVWFSIYDTKAGATVTDATVSGATGPNADGYYYAPSGSAISVAMKDGWNLRFTNLPSDTTYTFVEGTLAEGFAFNKAELTQGEDSTFSGGQTTTGTIENTKTSYYVTYTNDYALTDLEITKVWEDANNQDGKRLTADELKAKLTLSPAVEGKEPTVKDNGDGTYTITYTGLPRFNNGQEVTYKVTESAIDGYTTTGSPAEDHGTITNKHVPETVDVNGQKIWDDDEYFDESGKAIGDYERPVIKANLLADGEKIDEQTITGPEWKFSFTDLPKNSKGKEIVYTVTETLTGDSADAYTVVIDPENFTITNTPKSKEEENPTKITILKVDNNTDEDKGLTGAEFTLTKPDGKTEVFTTGSDGTVEVPFEVDGTYSLKETKAPTGYQLNNKTFTIKVDKELNTIQLKEDKTIWQWIYDLIAGSTDTEFNKDKLLLTVPDTPILTEIEAVKVWDDNNNQDGKRPTDVTVVMTGEAGSTQVTTDTQKLNESNQWTYKWEELPTYVDGQEVEYNVIENPVPEKYSVTTEKSEDGKTVTITNHYTPEKTSVKVTKAWSDKDNQDGIRPTSVKVQLMAGEKAQGDPVTLDASNEWTYTWTGLDKFAEGSEIAYTVDEVKDNVITGTDGPGTYAIKVEGSIANGFTVTNTHTPEKTKVKVTKAWNDADDQDGIRPASVKVQLMAGEESQGDAVTLNEGNEWTYTWDNLDKYADGDVIAYTVDEVKDDVITGTDGPGTYALKVTGDKDTGFTVTNTHTPEQTEVTVTKAWNDADDQDGIRPDSVSVQLKAGDTAQGDPVTLSESNEWTYTWTELDKYADGEEIAYTVDEVKDDVITGTDGVGTYAIKVDGNIKDGFTVTNTHTPELTKSKVIKVWEDKNNQDGKRPTSLTVTLNADGEATETTAILNADNEWTFETEKNLPKYRDKGTEIKYTWTEDEEALPEGYEQTETKQDGNTTTLTNAYKPEETTASVLKVWNDKDNQDGIRPESLTVTLYADGVATDTTVTLNEDNKWTDTVTGLPMYRDGGTKIVYTWQEDESALPEGYELEDTSSTGTLTTITNKYEPETIDIPVEKVWKDYNNRANTRPKDITVNLMNGKTKVDSATFAADEDGNWSYTFKDKPKYENKGKEIKYTVTEESVPKYETTIDGTTITNTYEAKPVTAQLEATKNISGYPENGPEVTFTFELVDAEGTVDTQTATFDGKNTKANITFKELEFTDPGKYTYTIKETKGGGSGWKNDTTKYPVTITVTDDGSGQLQKSIKYEDGDAAFLNTYKAEPAEVTLGGHKELTGRDTKPLKAGEFSFELKGAIGETTIDETVSNKADSSYEFSTLEFDKAGTYNFTIEELNTGVAGVTYGFKTYNVTVTVTDPGDGQLVAEISGDVNAQGNNADYTNTYEAKPVKIKLDGTKKLTGRDLKAGDFEFTITGDEPLPEKTSVSNGADGKFSFGEIEYTAAGEYKYTVKETKGSAKGVTYDESEYTVKVTVTDPGDGQLKATVEGGEALNFINTYKGDPTKVQIVGKKIMVDYEKPLEGGEFDFTISGTGEVADDTEETPTVEQPADNSGQNEDPAPAEATNDDTVTGDEVEADEVDEAEAAEEPAATEEPAAEEPAAEEPAAEATNDESGADTVAATATKTIDAPLPEGGATVQNDAEGDVIFGEIEFTEPGTYTYEITESGSMPGVTNDPGQPKTVTVVVTDNKEGDLVATIDPDSLPHFTFFNKYNTPPTPSSITDQIPVNKELAGHSLKEGDFTFVLECPDGSTIEAKNDANGEVKFAPYTFTKAGDYEFKVSEKKGGSEVITYDGAVYTAIAHVTNNYDGKELEVEWTFEGGDSITFKNTWDDKVIIDPPVQKVVKGNPKKDETFTFKLEAQNPEDPMPEAADGNSSMTMTITGSGKDEFGEITFTEPGEYVYKVTEVAGSNPDYKYDGTVYHVKAIVTEDDNYKLHVQTVYYKNDAEVDTAIFKFVNTYEGGDEPGTGDRNNLLANMILLTLSGLGIAGASLFRRRKEEN